MPPTNYNTIPRAAYNRGNASHAIEHDKHDLPLRLVKEEDTNSKRQFTPEMLARGDAIRKRYLENPKSVTQKEIDSVPTIRFRFVEDELGYLATTDDFNSLVNVDEDRLLNPSAHNGGGTSRYGQGRSIMIAKRNPKMNREHGAIFHKGGDAKAYGYTGPDIKGRDVYNVLTDTSLVSNEKSKPWFRSFSYIEKETLEKVKTPVELGKIIRETLLVTTDQNSIDQIRRYVEVENKNGKVVFESNSWDDRWKCWEELVNTRSDIFKLWPKTTKQVDEDFFADTLHYQMKKEDKQIVEFFPNYGHASFDDSRAFVFLGDEMVYDCPAYKMAKGRDGPLAAHPASQTTFGVLIHFRNKDGLANNVDALPTPATVKIQFLKNKTWEKAMDVIYQARPEGWIKYIKPESPKKRAPAASAQPPAVPDLPVAPQLAYPNEIWVDTPHGVSIKDEVKRKAGETDTAYMKRVKTNRTSRESKKQKRNTPPATPEPEPQPQPPETHVEVPEIVPVPVPATMDTDLQWVNENLAQLRWAHSNLERLQQVLARSDVLNLLA